MFDYENFVNITDDITFFVDCLLQVVSHFLQSLDVLIRPQWLQQLQLFCQLAAVLMSEACLVLALSKHKECCVDF